MDIELSKEGWAGFGKPGALVALAELGICRQGTGREVRKVGSTVFKADKS